MNETQTPLTSDSWTYSRWPNFIEAINTVTGERRIIWIR